MNLSAGTLYGRPIADWTLDGVTDSLGRPTAVSPGIEGISGAQLSYHGQGVSLRFRPKEEDAAQHLSTLVVYFTRSWDADHTAWYQPFGGAVTPAVDANWKQSRLETEFASLHPTVETADETKRKLRASGLSGFADSATSDFLSVTVSGTVVSFALEPSTKFLERVVIRPVADSAR